MKLVRSHENKRMYFIGVSTKHSSIMEVFPLWMQELGRPEVSLEGIDLRLHDDPQNYRRAVTLIKEDKQGVGALVTTHKINLLRAAHDLFDYLDPLAQLTGEVSCIAKMDGRLEGYAKDPLSGGISLDTLLGPSYFERTAGQVLFLGAGGSTTALVLHLLGKQVCVGLPRRVSIVDRCSDRIEELHAKVELVGRKMEVDYYCHEDPKRNDKLMTGLPPGSVVINATGMGKDLPGSPITDAGLFPLQGVAWELNYRGELQFLKQALAQGRERNLLVEDGWVYFLHGWTQVIAQVLTIHLTRQKLDRLAEIAKIIRPNMRVPPYSDARSE
jgi:shikimate dehydrogenase